MDIKTAASFNAIVALFAVALIMVTTARAEPPRVSADSRTALWCARASRAYCCDGLRPERLVGGAFYALVPAWMQDQGAPQATIALFMLVAVLGGFAFQIPVGRLSDRFDRRMVLAFLGLGFAGTAFIMVLLPRSLPTILPAAVLLGGFMSTLYPVCVAHAHDRMPADRVVAVSGRLILVSGLGSVLGPLIGASLMTRFEIDGVFYFMAAAVLLLALVAGFGRLMTQPPRHREAPFEILTPQAGPLAHDQFELVDEPSQLNDPR